MTSRRPILTTASRRVLYSGADYLPSELLKDALKPLDCFVVRSPVYAARTLIRSDIKYALLLFDDPAGAELESYARTLPHRRQTPVVIVKKSESFGGLLDTIRRRLGKIRVK